MKTLNLKLKYGEDFTGSSSEDSSSVFLNEKAAALYGGEDIIGSTITLTDGEGEGESTLDVRVRGIIENFHYQELNSPIGPVVIGYIRSPFEDIDDIVIRIAENSDIPETLAFIEGIHNKFDENDVMTWEFMDDMVQRSYEQEAVFRDVFLGASVISMIIAILGIIGLASYNVVAKTKEYGIRKVLGANYSSLIIIHGKFFIKFMFLAAVLVTPLTWWLASSWLANYSFRIDLTAIPFLLAFTLILASSFMSLWLIVHKSARKNPVDALRYE